MVSFRVGQFYQGVFGTHDVARSNEALGFSDKG
jgi:hypothetical protein